MKKVKKHKILFHNFPDCSMLKSEILLHADEAKLQFESSESLLKTIKIIQKDSSIQVLFYVPSLEDFSHLIDELTTINSAINANTNSVVIIPELNREESRKLKELGVRKFFTLYDPTMDMIDYFEMIFKSNNPDADDDKIVIQGDKRFKEVHSEPKKKKFELNVASSDEIYDDFRENILENTNVKNLKLEAGELEVKMMTEQFPIVDCKLEEFTEQTIEVEILDIYEPELTDQIDINIVFNYNRCRVEVLLSGEVIDSNQSIDGRSLVSIRLSQDETESFNNFMALYQKRQKNIDEFMVLAKGH